MGIKNKIEWLKVENDRLKAICMEEKRHVAQMYAKLDYFNSMGFFSRLKFLFKINF